jgi:hypothetical protein
MSKDLESLIPGAIILDSARSRVQLMILLVGGNYFLMECPKNGYQIFDLIENVLMQM